MQNRSGPAWEAALAGVPQQRHGEEAVDQAIGGADDDRGADDAGGADDDSAEQLQVKTGDTLTSQPDTPLLCSPALPALPEHALHTSHPLALMSDACPPLSLTLPSPPSSQASGYSAEQLVDAGFMVIEIFLDEEKQDLYSQILLKLENDLDDARNLLYQHLTTADVDLFDLIWFKLDVRSMF